MREKEHVLISRCREEAKARKKAGSDKTHMQILHELAKELGYKSWASLLTKVKSYG